MPSGYGRAGAGGQSTADEGRADVFVTGDRALLDLNGEGEAVGGIVVMRYGENAAELIRRVKEKIAAIDRGRARKNPLVHRAVREDQIVVQTACSSSCSHFVCSLSVPGWPERGC